MSSITVIGLVVLLAAAGVTLRFFWKVRLPGAPSAPILAGTLGLFSGLITATLGLIHLAAVTRVQLLRTPMRYDFRVYALLLLGVTLAVLGTRLAPIQRLAIALCVVVSISLAALLATDRAGGEVIGSSRYFGHDPEGSVVEIGWSFLARACWGGRYNGEMKRLLLEHAFRSVARVIFVVGPDNRRSQRAVEKIGGVRTGTLAEVRGQPRVVYELSPERYARAGA